jgi:nitrate/nitrite-specific signal transduction histidine kinase
MRERAKRMGTRLEIISSAEKGTRVTLKIPAAIAFVDSREKQGNQPTTDS